RPLRPPRGRNRAASARASQGAPSLAGARHQPRYALNMTPLEYVSLADQCTMGVGGPPRFFVEARDEAAVVPADEGARASRVPLRVLGGAANLVVADAGLGAHVVKTALRGVNTRLVDGAAELTAAAGEPWDELVRDTVERGWAGLECLSGIPGL